MLKASPGPGRRRHAGPQGSLGPQRRGAPRLARPAPRSSPRERGLRSEVNNSLIIVNFFHKIKNFRQISDLFSQI